jgi:hypothetical protein
MLLKQLLFTGCTVFLFQYMQAQEKEPASYAQASVNYLSNFVYQGRKDSLRTPYITPQIGYYHKSGFFGTASVSYLTRPDSGRADLFTLGLGFEKDLTEKVNIGAWLEKYFYNDKSTNVQAEIKAMMGIYGSYDFGPVSLGASAAHSFATQGDWSTGLFLTHVFNSKDEKWEITPKAELNAATQNYYNSYFQNRRVGTRRRLPNGTLINVPAVNLEDATKFRFLENSYSTEIKYTTGKWEFSLSPAFIIPLNPAVIRIGNKKITEKIENSFTVELGIAFSF